jgi:hypothetical protein
VRTTLRRHHGFPHKRRWAKTFVGGEVLPVTFPTSPLVTRVHIALGADPSVSYLTWNWLDITEFVRHDLGVAVTAGRQDERGQVTASRCQIKLENNDGRFTRRNKLGPYYGLLTKNTPIWIELNPGSGFADRYFGFINEWPTRWTDPSGTDCTVTIQAAGIMRRLQQGRVLRSPLFTTITGPASSSPPDAYWPMEDAVNSTQFASGLIGGPSIAFIGDVSLAAVDVAPGSRPFAEFAATGTLTNSTFGPVSISGTSGYISASFVFYGTKVDGQNPGWDPITIQLAPDSTISGNVIYASVLGRWNTGVFDQLGMTWGTGGIHAGVSFDPFDGTAHAIQLIARQSGADIIYELWVDGVLGDTETHAATTLGTPAALYGPKGRDFVWGAPFGSTNNTGTSLGLAHITIHGEADILSASTFHSASTGWDGEQAHVRAIRVCDEQGIPIFCQASTSTPLGSQPVGTLLDVLRDAEAADQGVLYEFQFGLGYQALSERYGLAVVFGLDFDASQIAGTPEPADDDQRLVNRFTATRSGGSEATAELTTGMLGTGAGGSDVYDDSATVNVETDGQLIHYAGWKVRLGTVDEDRWPQIGFHLHRSPELIPSWLTVPFGGRINIANPPSQMSSETIDGIIEGYAERWDTVSWTAALNVSPASPYVVGELDGTDTRLDSATSTLAAAVTAGATSMSVATSDSRDLWTTSGSDYPQDVTISGINVTVTAVSGASSPQTFTVTGSTVARDLAAGAEVHVRYPLVLAF